ncbi:hypothetical protein SAMN06893096_10295 [Geodermatophilus pulveris]|uniref:Uncharacterized protein n=1 Tax=Geodermatophilus pulveris TaxID=1564159 RepID=A0A239BV16_9ACTN|nr:hypothetical protein SAMN06893096_10295 [Geodermatophilus pulveris]
MTLLLDTHVPGGAPRLVIVTADRRFAAYGVRTLG